MFSNDALFTVVVVLLTMGALVLPRFAPDLVLMGALTLLLMAGVLTPTQMLEGLSAPFHPGAMKYYKEAGLKE